MTTYRTCPGCNMPFQASRSNQITCSDNCRKRNLRARAKAKKVHLAIGVDQVALLLEMIEEVQDHVKEGTALFECPTGLSMELVKKLLREAIEK